MHSHRAVPQRTTASRAIGFATLALLALCPRPALSQGFMLRFDGNLSTTVGQGPAAASNVFIAAGKSKGGGLFLNNSFLQYAAGGNISSQEGTLCTWYAPDAVFMHGDTSRSYTFLKWGGTGGMVFNVDGYPYFKALFNAWVPNQTREVFAYAGDCTPGRWYHVAFTWSSSARRLRVYIDGELKAQKNLTGGLPGFSSPVFDVGADRNTPARSCLGRLDDFSIFTWELSPEEIRQIGGKKPDADLVATPETVRADNSSESVLQLTYKNAQGAPVVGHQIRFYSSRIVNDTFSPDTAITDAAGRASVRVRSGKAGISTITVHDLTDWVTLPCTAQVTFTPEQKGPKFTVHADRGEGATFLQGIYLTNRVTARFEGVEGTGHRVRFTLNGQTAEVPAPDGSASITYDMGSALQYSPEGDWSTLKVVAVDGNGEESDPKALHWKGLRLPEPLDPSRWQDPPRAEIDSDGVEYTLSVELPAALLDGSAIIEAELPLMSGTRWGSVVGTFKAQVTVSLRPAPYPATGVVGAVAVAVGREWGSDPPRQTVSVAGFGVDSELTAFAEWQFMPKFELSELGLESSATVIYETPDLMPRIAAFDPPLAALIPVIDVFGRFSLPDFEGKFAWDGNLNPKGGAATVGSSAALVVAIDRIWRSLAEAEIEGGIGSTYGLQFPGTDENAALFWGCRYLSFISVDLFLRGRAQFKVGFQEDEFVFDKWTKSFRYPAGAPKRGPQAANPVPSSRTRPPDRSYLAGREPYHRLVAGPKRHPFQPWLDAGPTAQGSGRRDPGAGWDVTEAKLVENVSHVTSPALTYRDGKAAILYVYDRPGLPAHQSLDIRMLRETASGWSDTDVTNDTALDSQPTVAMDAAGRLVAAWTRMADVAESDELPARYAKAEIVWAAWDPVSETWSAPVALTSDAVLDLNPRLVKGRDGFLYLAWLKSPDNVFPSDFQAPDVPHTDLWLARWDGAAFVEVAAAITRVDTTENVALGFGQSGERVAVWSRDRDGDATTADSALWFSRWSSGGGWTAPERVAPSDDKPHNTPALTMAAGDVPTLFYARAGLPHPTAEGHTEEQVVVSTPAGGVWASPQMVARSGNMVSLDVIATTDGKASAMWTAASEKTADIWTTVYDPATSTFSLPVRLTDDQGDERQLCAAWDPAGNPSAVYTKRRLVLENRDIQDEQGGVHTVQVLIPTAHDLYALTHRPAPDLAVSDADLLVTPANPVPGSSVTLRLAARNLRALAARDVEVRFVDRTPAGDTTIGTALVSPAVLVGGGQGIAEAVWTIPNDGQAHTIVALVDPDGEVAETDETNNSVSRALLALDLVAVPPRIVEYLPDGSLRVELTIHNASPVAVGAPVEWDLWRGDPSNSDYIDGGLVDPPAPRGSRVVTIVWQPGFEGPSDVPITFVVDPRSKLPDANRTNNMAVGSAALRPDLMINPHDAVRNMNPDGTATIEVTLQNVGWCAAESVVLQAFDGVPGAPGTATLGSTTVATLARSAAIRLAISVPGSGGGGEVYVVADPADAIAEVSNANNVAILALPARAATLLTTVSRSGQALTLTTLSATLVAAADASGLAGEAVAFAIDGTQVGVTLTGPDGSAQLAWTISDGPGTRSITASFEGDADYSPSSASATLTIVTTATKTNTINRTGVGASTVALRGYLYRKSDSSPLSGKTLAFSIAGTQVGTGATGSTGSATLNWIIDTGPAARQIRVDFAGDACFEPSYGTATLTVLTYDTAIAVPGRSGEIGETASLRAYLFTAATALPVAGKNVTFRINDTAVGSAATNSTGRALLSWQIPDTIPPGEHALLADWPGDAGYRPSSGAAILTVDRGVTYVWVMSRSMARGTSAYLRTLVRRMPDLVPLANKTIRFSVDGTELGSAVTGADGRAAYLYAAPSGMATGDHQQLAEFAGDTHYLPGAGTAILTITP